METLLHVMSLKVIRRHYVTHSVVISTIKFKICNHMYSKDIKITISKLQKDRIDQKNIYIRMYVLRHT